MKIECPHCNIEQEADDIARTLKKGRFKCPVCGRWIPSPLAGHLQSASSSRTGKYFAPVCILLGIVAAFAVIHFLTVTDNTPPTVKAIAPAAMPSGSSTFPVQAVSAPTPAAPVSQTSESAQKALDKMQIIEQVAARYHNSHSYTLEGGFVCLDMAIDVWNQLRTYGIVAKIMGGNIRENITAWSYRQLVWEGNHAWVVAELSPTEKVAIETTSGAVIKPGMQNASVYFTGIEFDTPAEIKRFESLRQKGHEVCKDADHLIRDWNENVAGKQHKSEETIAKQSRLEQRKKDCENTFKELEEFESKARFY